MDCPQWETHICSLFTGWRCLCRQRCHGDFVIMHHQSERSSPCACSSSKVPIAPMGKCLIDMSISILFVYDGCCLELPDWSTCYLCLKHQVPMAPMGDSRFCSFVCRVPMSLFRMAQSAAPGQQSPHTSLAQSQLARHRRHSLRRRRLRCRHPPSASSSASSSV